MYRQRTQVKARIKAQTNRPITHWVEYGKGQRNWSSTHHGQKGIDQIYRSCLHRVIYSKNKINGSSIQRIHTLGLRHLLSYQTAFHKLKSLLTSNYVMHHPDPTAPYKLHQRKCHLCRRHFGPM